MFLTSVLKRMDSTVVDAIKQAKDGTFKGGVIVARWRAAVLASLPSTTSIRPFRPS